MSVLKGPQAPTETLYGSVNPTYPLGDPRYGTPINFPGTSTPLTLNEAEMKALRNIRSSGAIPTIPY